jgi:hypothetical protein
VPASGLDGKLVRKCIRRVKHVMESPHSAGDPDAAVILKAASTAAKLHTTGPKHKDDGADDAVARKVFEDCSVSLRQRAVSRGYSYFFNMGKDKVCVWCHAEPCSLTDAVLCKLQSLLDSSGGDMLFLLQKLWLITRNKPSWHAGKAKRLVMKVLQPLFSGQECVHGMESCASHSLLAVG